MSETPEITPLMKQYYEQKANAPDAFMFFRMGDFYELFGDDAVVASKILDIVLTSRDKNKTMPMAGVPAHSVNPYIQKLLKAGKKVAICEQMEDPSEKVGKGIVKREIIRTLTPALQFESSETDHHFLACVSTGALALLDVSTGDLFYRGGLSSAELQKEIGRMGPKHILFRSAAETFEVDSLKETLPPNFLHSTEVQGLFKDFFEVANFDLDTESLETVACLLKYASKTQNIKKGQTRLRLPRPLDTPGRMQLGLHASEHLDLFSNDPTQTTLFSFLKRTHTAMGTRHLKRVISEPLTQPREIQQRQEIIQMLAHHSKADAALQEIYDLERILGRVSTGLASPKDTWALGKSLEAFENLQPIFLEIPGLRSKLSELHLAPLMRRILSTQNENPPHTARDTGIFKKGFNTELDELIDLNENGEAWMTRYEVEQREATGISNLKVRFNRVFGYYIEISQAQAKNAPPHYQRKQTMVGAERFFTEELKIFEDKLVSAQSRLKKLESRLFEELLENILTSSAAILVASEMIAELDVGRALSMLIQKNWVFPVINDSKKMHILSGRHPVIDSDSFIANDLDLSNERRQMILTGPNMGGKSTYMRQVALIVILGQMGCPVPAKEATWGTVSSILTRIGAKDAIAKGQSTFMVEMNELAAILNEADPASLLILDEIGRGTSTFDGISVAWSSLEWIAKSLKCRTLFATHYHELTRLHLSGVFNAHMAVEGSKGRDSKLRFLFEVKEGPSNESFGIQVAQLAGLPKPVIQRAWQVLELLEKGNLPQGNGDPNQLSFFQTEALPPAKAEFEAKAKPHPVMEELRGLNINETSPMEALRLLASLQEKLPALPESIS